jgi:hypothetical protein
MVLKCLFVLLAVVVLPSGQDRLAYKPADEAIQELVREALADRLATRDIPDVGLLQNAREILVRREMPGAGLTLAREALPDLPGLSLSLIETEAARAQANVMKRNVHFIAVDRPAISGTTATLWIGVDFEMPKSTGMIKMCCCSAEGHFEKRDGQWRFVKWGIGRCV